MERKKEERGEIVYTRKSFKDRFWAKVKKTDSCWLWIGSKSGKGYGNIFVEKIKGVSKQIKAHRASWIIHNGKIADGLFVCHKCDVPLCVNPAHLFLGNNKDNMMDCFKKGRSVVSSKRIFPVGSEHPLSKLTWDSVSFIRKNYRPVVYGMKKIADKLGVSKKAVLCVLKNKSWKECYRPKEVVNG